MSGLSKEDLQHRYIAGFADGVSETKGIITKFCWKIKIGLWEIG